MAFLVILTIGNNGDFFSDYSGVCVDRSGTQRGWGCQLTAAMLLIYSAAQDYDYPVLSGFIVFNIIN